MTTPRRCPNCCVPVIGHPDNGCVLASLVSVVRDRGELTERKLRELHAQCDVDALWERLGAIVDDLQAGHFTAEAP